MAPHPPIDADLPVSTSCLIVVHGPQPELLGHRLELPANGALLVGRNAPSFGPAALGDPKISGEHLEFEVSDESVVARDLESKNGMRIRGQRMQKGRLAPGDFIQLGNTFLCFRVESPFPRACPDTLLGGVSWPMHRLRMGTKGAAAGKSSLFVSGPKGAGKGRVAQELHRLSRAKGPFVALNCATLAGQLAQSELFGHVKGAFTGADSDARGAFARAAGGTLFLDEVAALPVRLQPKFLRALREGVIRPLGAPQDEPHSARVCCASNEDLNTKVEDGTFSSELLSALRECQLESPPLSARPEDIGWLAAELLSRGGHEDVRVSAELMWEFLGLPWRLNVRGLERCLLGHAPGAREGVIQLDDELRAFCQSERELARMPHAGGRRGLGGEPPSRPS